MTHDSKLNVLILATEPAHRLRESLAQAGVAVWQSRSEVPPQAAVDVIVSDSPVENPTGNVGIVGIGTAGAADATLGPDFTDRELRLAVQLVAQIARLRRERDEQARAREEIVHLAQTDPLTGLPNRRAWEEHLRVRLAQAHRPLWLGVVDLDGFKQVNDELGMAKGDEVLVRAAHALAEQLRRDDVVARIGGDEFGLLLGEMAEDSVPRVLDRVRTAVAEQAAPSEAPRVTASIGYVSTGEVPSDAATLFAAAERAMRAAKRAGGNRAERSVLPKQQH